MRASDKLLAILARAFCDQPVPLLGTNLAGRPIRLLDLVQKPNDQTMKETADGKQTQNEPNDNAGLET